MSEMKLAVLGAAGRMGQTLTRVISATPGCVVAGGIELKGSPAIGRDIGEVAGLDPLGVAITDDPLPVFAHVDGVLDFTSPASTTAFAALAAQARIVHVIGTTGLSEADQAKIEAAAGASRAKHSALQARFRRVLRHRGPKKAVVAVAHALLRMVYHVLADGTVYREAGAGADYYDRHHTQRVTRRAVQALERQGYRVILEPAA